MKGFGKRKETDDKKESNDIGLKNDKNYSILSHEKLKETAVKYHSKGNLKEAIKYYELLFKKGYEDPIVISN